MNNYYFATMTIRAVFVLFLCFVPINQGGDFLRCEAFRREIQPEEMWLYRYPRKESYIPSKFLIPFILVAPSVVIWINYKIEKDKIDVREAILAFSLTMPLTAMTTYFVKILTGKLRPDFFWRCFPSGYVKSNMVCNGDKKDIIEGRKSFPSAHSSLSFASMGFLTLYLMAKLQIFNDEGRGRGLRIFICLLPIFVAIAIAISRTCDYHHHDQDILFGSLLGLFFAYICYRQYYPGVAMESSNLSYAAQKQQDLQDCT